MYWYYRPEKKYTKSLLYRYVLILQAREKVHKVIIIQVCTDTTGQRKSTQSHYYTGMYWYYRPEKKYTKSLLYRYVLILQAREKVHKVIIIQVWLYRHYSLNGFCCNGSQLWKESLNSDGQQFHKYQQYEQMPLILTQCTQIKDHEI